MSHDPECMARPWRKIALSMPERHFIFAVDVDEKRLTKVFSLLHESGSETCRDIIRTRGMGPRTLAVLALVSEVGYEAPPGFNDPARFSFTHGGKDGHSFPGDKKAYDRTTESLQTCLDKARIGDRERIDPFRRLSRYEKTTGQCPEETTMG